MLVEVNPANVVSVPNDHDCQKCRVTEYKVIGECVERIDRPVYDDYEDNDDDDIEYPVDVYTDISGYTNK